MTACESCLRRMWLLETLAGHIERQRSMVENILELSDLELITALAGQHRPKLLAEYATSSDRAQRSPLQAAEAAGISLVCRHDRDYPDNLLALGQLTPAVLSVCGQRTHLAQWTSPDCVAVVGTRRATQYGLKAAFRMGEELAAAGITVVSGMAQGIDSAAHEGALAGGGFTTAVLAGPPHRPYPAQKIRLFEQILSRGAVISEFGPQMSTWRWALRARNRIIAGLAAATVVIEAPARSGTLITVRHADACERWIGVFPGPVGVRQFAGAHLLLAKSRAGRDEVDPRRVRVVRDAQDVLDLIHGEGIVEVPTRSRPQLSPPEVALLDMIGAGHDNVTKIDARQLPLLAALELKGCIARGAGGALTVLG